MSIMQSLLAEFAPERPVERPSHAVEASPICSRCQGIDHWQPYGSTDWYCTQCDPPPTQSMVANRTGAPTIKSSWAYAIGRYVLKTASCGGNRIQFTDYQTSPVCSCGSHMVTEHTWSDGVSTYECASCNASIAADKVGLAS